MRKPFQGIWNIVRFNWHFYALSMLVFSVILILFNYAKSTFGIWMVVLGLLILLSTVISLAVSFYVYDLSGLYKLNWIADPANIEKFNIVNINAGFDETSILLNAKFSDSQLLVFDFYDPKKHTEPSIKRARKAYGLFPNTKSVSTTNLPAADNSADKIFVIFAAHEIRNEQERIEFFKEVKRVIRPTGEIFIMEHLRDLPNFLAYNLGFLHFYSKQSWLEIFGLSKLTLVSEQKITPFISIYTLTKYGASS